MAFRELHVVEVKEMLRLWALGYGYRVVGARTGTDRKTVRRYVEAAVAAGFARDGSVELDDALIGAVVSAVRPGAPSEVGLIGITSARMRRRSPAGRRKGCAARRSPSS